MDKIIITGFPVNAVIGTFPEERKQPQKLIFDLTLCGDFSKAGLNDTLTGLSQEWNTLTTELLGTIAPALTDVGEVLKGVLKEVNDYLKSDEGKEKLK